MFTGQAPGKRKINLGGKMQTAAHKQALIEQSRKEREQRELARKQTEVSIQISRFARGFFVRKWCKCSLIELLESSLDRMSAQAYGTANPFSVIFLIDRVLVGPTQKISDKTLGDVLNRFGPALLSQPVWDSTVIVRVSALIRQTMLSEALALQAVPFIQRSISLSLSFIPKSAAETLKMFSILDQGSAILLLNTAIERGIEDRKLVQCSLAFFETQTQNISPELVQLLVKLSFISSMNVPGFDVKKICANLVPILVFMMGRGNHAQVKRLMVSLQSLTGLLSEDERQALDSFLLDVFLQSEHTPGQYVLLELARLDKLREETLYRLATQTKLCEDLGTELISLLDAKNSDGRIPGLVTRFATLYSRVVAGLTSVLSPDCIEKLFPLLNAYAYESITQYRPMDSAVFELIRAVYAKKHMYPALRKEDVWLIPDSASFIPNSVYGYDLTLHSEEDIELFHSSEEQERNSPMNRRSVFDTLIEFMPHVIPFNRRLRIFAAAIAEDQLKHTRQSWSLRLPWEGGRVKKVRRDFLLQDGMEIIAQASREVMRIEFVGHDGSVEAGIDGGGLFKEFMQQWTISVMNPEFGLFTQLPNGRLSPAIDAYRVHADADKWFRTAGRAVGKALYEMVLLETHLGEAFLHRVLGRPYSLDQLQEIDEGLYRNLKFVNDCENVEDLDLTFTVSGATGGETHELVPNGQDLPVTTQNKLRYVLLASWYYLARQLDRPAAAFAAGLSELLPLSRMKLFSPSEINLLVSGEQKKGFNVEDLKANVVYGGGYSEHSTTVKLLWQVLTEFTDDDRSAFLSFVTSAPRPPLLGFRVLHPKFGINRVPEPDRLPTSSTCANLLKLPDYQDKRLLKKKLHAAIYSQSGFDLS
jgi:ubiquitin-protein ligase E3 C